MNLNKVFLIGRITSDINLRVTPSGQPVASFGLATNRTWNDRSGQRQEEAEFHNIVVWGKQAELCNQYLAKGRLVMIEGRIRTRSYQAATGEKKYRTEIIAERIQFGPRSAGDVQAGFGNSGFATGKKSEPVQNQAEGLETIDLDEETIQDLTGAAGGGESGMETDDNPPF